MMYIYYPAADICVFWEYMSAIVHFMRWQTFYGSPDLIIDLSTTCDMFTN
jgi:hypothetical protein